MVDGIGGGKNAGGAGGRVAVGLRLDHLGRRLFMMFKGKMS